jgi:Ran GTPase-activating protein 1
MSILEYSIKGKTQKFDTAADVADLIKDLSAMPDVESVVLGGNTFGVEACKAFALELSSKHKLKVIIAN